MDVAICDNDVESLEVLLEVLQEVDKEKHVFEDYFSFFAFLNEHANYNDLILMISDEMFADVRSEISYFIKKFDIVIPVFTYRTGRFFLSATMNYIWEYTEYYTADYIRCLEKIKDSFLKFGKVDAVSIVSRFCEKQFFYKGENKEVASKSIFPLGISENIESEVLSSVLNQQQKQLLTYLVANYQGVKLEDIMLYIWNCYDASKKQNAYVLLHSLRKVLEKQTEGRYTIEKSCKKYKLAKIGV